MNVNKSVFYFFLSPVLGLIYAVKDFRQKYSTLVLFLFCLCFGLCFTVDNVRREGSVDGISMRIAFEENSKMSVAQYADYIAEYFQFDKGAQDIYITSVSFFIGCFTDNYHVFFLILSTVFAFFQIKCLKYLIREQNYTNSLLCIIITCLFLWNNISNINGARFWTAAWIALYTVFKVFHDKDLRYFLLAACIFMIHASYAFFPVLMLFAYFVPYRRKIYLSLFLISWAFSFFATNFNFISLEGIDLPFIITKKVEAYTDKDFIDSYSTGSGFFWVSLLFEAISIFTLNLLIYFVLLKQKHLKDAKAASVVKFMIILAIFSNFASVVPTLGGRFFMVDLALIAYSFLVVCWNFKIRKIIYFVPFAWFMNLYSLMQLVLGVLDIGFLFSPFISFFRYLII